MEEKKKEKTEAEEYEEALKYLELDKAEVEKKACVTFKGKDDIHNRVTSLKNIVLEYQMNLEGKTYDGEKGGYIQTGKALAGAEFIRLSSGILNSFAQESNLLTTKDQDTFIMQFKDAHEKVNMSLHMKNRAVPERTGRAILKMWKDSFWNICEIIIGSGDNMKSVFGNLQKDLQDDLQKKTGF